MATYYYRARNRRGEIIEGSILSDSEWAARKSLGKQSLTPLTVSRFNLKIMLSQAGQSPRRFSSSVTLEELITLMNQIEMGMSVGIPIIQMFQFVQSDVTNKRLLDALREITAEITQGGSLHASFGKHPDIFDSTIVGLIKTGEVTGKLDETLSRISALLEQRSMNQAKIKSATFYPKLVIFTLIAVTFIVVYFIVPKIKSFLGGFGAELPLVTRIVVGISDFFIQRWYWIILLFIIGRYSFLAFIRSAFGKRLWDRFLLKLPALGKIFLYIELNNFSVVLELLLSSGIPLLESLETLKNSQRNELFKEALTKCQQEISKGGTLTNGMENNPIFPGTYRSLIGMGEETGRLSPILVRTGRYYQTQLGYLLDNLSKAIEPLLLFIIFVAVLTLALAVFLPVWKMNTVVRG
ncbi:type II secretion system F family protein [bacterium]|jgi:MSHA biogenesis protein MshG|nr:type II secretion system F family protein [bacterium]